MKKIPLTQGKFALVDDEDYERVINIKWHYNHGYAMRSVPGPRGYKKQGMHRLILNAPTDKLVDHINMDRLDNQKNNLRLCSYSQNRLNSKLNSNNSTGFKGVTYKKRRRKKPWEASAHSFMDGYLYLGSYKTREEAAKAYNTVVTQLDSEFYILNNLK